MESNNQKIVLKIGELVFGKGSRHLQTLLGSCVAITLWHPQKRLGGMCHFALPVRGKALSEKKLDPRYGDDCLALFRKLAEEKQTELHEYQACIYGGGNMLENSKVQRIMRQSGTESNHVGELNAAQAFALLMQEKIRIIEADVGEQGYRKVLFDPITGQASCKFVSVTDKVIKEPEPKKVTRILVVDDSKVTRSLLSKSLEEEGYEVFVAENGADGIQAFKLHQPDLVILDVEMPIMDGYECCSHLRQLAAEVPVLILTGNEDINSMATAFESGASDFINKPIRIPALKQRMFHALSKFAD
ncbi:response regulator [Marinospirillum sp.]|uniref:response regulator n=1 Tax=Marinospirillum sp. TaxID=2183934 RepID=UPI00384F6FEF